MTAPTRTRLAAGLVAVVAAAGLTACGSGGGGGAGTTEGGVTTISFWNSYTSSDRPAVEEVVRRFNESQSAVRVQMTVQPSDVMSSTLLPAYQAGQGPTVVAVDASNVPSYVRQRVFQPVDDIYGNGGLDPSTLPKASLDATIVDGKQYGVPFGATPTMMYWNKKLFAQAGLTKPPATLDEMADVAVKLTDKAKQQFGFAIADREAVHAWTMLMWANGGGVVSADGTRPALADPASVAAVTKWSGLVREQGISPVGLGGVEADALFGAGKAAMLINGPWASTGFKEAGVDYGIAPVPAGSATQTSEAVSTNMHLSAQADDAQKAAAYAFMKFWNSPESQTYWSVKTGYPPNRTDVAPSALAENPTAQAFAARTGSQFYLGGLVKASQIDSDVVVPSIQRITAGQGSAQDVLTEASTQIQGLLAG